jgi:peptidoglycan/LPS O-acetylase OafA/YrhL
MFYLPDLLGFAGTELYGIYRYIVALVCTPLIVLLHRFERTQPPTTLNRWAGEMSYPIFLLHWPLAAPIAYHLLKSSDKSGALFALSFLAAAACGVAIVLWVERPLRTLRRRI